MKYYTFPTVIEEVDPPRNAKKNIQFPAQCILTDLEIIALLCSIGIPMSSSLQILSTTPIDANRYSTILQIVHGETGKTIKIIIDVGFDTLPNWEQFLNVTYNSGADCDLKVIVYSSPIHGSGSSMYPLDIANLVRINNSCSVPTYLLISDNCLHDQQRSISSFAIMAGPDNVDQKGSRQLPSRRQVEEGDFWLEKVSTSCDEKYFERDLRANELSPHFPVGSDLSMLVRWTEEGLIMRLDPESDDDEIKWLWEHKKINIEDRYPGSTLRLIYNDNGLVSLSIRLMEIPFSVCLRSTPSEKYDYADFVLEGISYFYQLFKIYLEQYEIGKWTIHMPLITSFILWDSTYLLTVIKELLEYLRRRLIKEGEHYKASPVMEFDDDWGMTEGFLRRKGLDPSTVLEVIKEYVKMDYPWECCFAEQFDLENFKIKLGLNPDLPESS